MHGSALGDGSAPLHGSARGEGRYRALAALLLAAVLAVLFHRSLFGGEVLSQADQLLAYAPWSEVAPPGYQPENPLLEDQSLLMVPWLGFAAERVRAGEFPLWNPYNYGGQPINAANSGAFLWPVNALYYAFPGQGFYAWSACVRLLLAGLFALCYLRALGVSRAAALPGALAFMLCGFLVVWLNHPHSNVALTLPLHLWLLERLARSARWRDAGLLALAVGAQLLGGHLQTSLHLMLVLLAYALFRALWGAPRLGPRALAQAGAGVVLGGALAGPQLLPMFEYLKESRGVVVLETLEQTSSLDALDAAALMVAPRIHGAPHTHDYTGPLGRNLNYNELAGGYVGRAALALALVGLVLRRREPHALFFGGLVLLCALVAWQVAPAHELFRAIPRLRSTNPTRLLLYVAFGLAALSALGLDALLQRLRISGPRAAAASAAVFGLTALELVLFARGYNPEVDPALVFPPTPTTDFLAQQAREDGPLRAVGVEQTTLRAAANLPYHVQMLTGYDKIEFAPLADLVSLLSTRPGATFVSEIPIFDRAEALPLASLLGVRFFLALEDLPPPLELVHTSPGGVRTFENKGALPRAFAAHAARLEPDPARRLELLGAPGLDPWTALVERAPAGLALAPGEPAPLAGGQVRLLSYAPREVVVEADLAGPGLLVLADTWDPGWSATVDGEGAPVERVDHALRGVWLAGGPRRVVFRYAPASFRSGLWLASLSAAAVAVLIAFGRCAHQAAGASCRS